MFNVIGFLFRPGCFLSFLAFPLIAILSLIMFSRVLSVFRKVRHKHSKSSMHCFPELCVPVAPEQRLANYQLIFGALIAKGAFNLNLIC